MASEIRAFTITVAAGSTAAAPQVTDMPMPARIVRRIRVRVPRGSNGLMGFAIGSSSTRVIPWNAGAYIVADDEVFTWDLENQIESGAWQMLAYNTGAYAHNLYVTFEMDPPQRAFLGGVPVYVTVGGGSVFSPPGSPPAPLDGIGAAKVNALRALQVAYGMPLTADAADVPPAGSLAAADYAATKSDLLELLHGLGLPGTTPGDFDPVGLAAGKANAVRAVRLALGMTAAPAPAVVPPVGTIARLAYDAAKAMARQALAAIQPG